MKDRLPTYPGRVKLTPVADQENVYDMTRADEPTEEGMALNKANLLTDETAALFGLGEDAVPNDVFSVIHSSFEQVDQTFTVVVSTSWTTDTTNGGYYQTATVDGVLASDNPVVDVVLGTDVDANSAYLDAWGDVTRITTADGSVTLYANKRAPESAFTMQLKVVR